MPTLSNTDLHFVVRRLPRDIRDLLSSHRSTLWVGGGFIRATIAGETPSDIDLFGISPEFLAALANDLLSSRPNSRLHKSDNALTLITPDRLQVQFITRWTFPSIESLISSFDFTIAQAAIGRVYSTSGEPAWVSAIGPSFYPDLAARRLVYTSPKRDEEPGGSMLRVLKFVKRGYTIQVPSLGAVIARLAHNLHQSAITQTEDGVAQVLTGLLREVDPLLTIDGLDIVDEHDVVPL